MGEFELLVVEFVELVKVLTSMLQMIEYWSERMLREEECCLAFGFAFRFEEMSFSPQVQP